MDKFYVINNKPEIAFGSDNCDVIFKTKEAAFENLEYIYNSSMRVYEVQAFGSLMTEGLNFKEVFDESKNKGNN